MSDTKQTMWALGWKSDGSTAYPPIAKRGAWKILCSKQAALAEREDERQDVQRVVFDYRTGKVEAAP